MQITANVYTTHHKRVHYTTINIVTHDVKQVSIVSSMNHCPLSPRCTMNTCTGAFIRYTERNTGVEGDILCHQKFQEYLKFMEIYLFAFLQNNIFFTLTLFNKQCNDNLLETKDLPTNSIV